MRAAYGDSLRNFFVQKANPLLLIDFGGTKVFDNATVDVNILLATKEPYEGRTLSSLFAGTKKELKESLFFSANASHSTFLPDTSWVILSPIEQSIKQKIEAIGTPLKDWDINIYRGVLTGFNEAFIIDEATKNKLIAEDAKSAEILRPILRGRDIKKYTAEFAGLYLIATLPSLKIDIDSYPAVKNYLLSFGKDRLEQSGKKDSRKATNNKWFETQDAISYWNDFDKPKIVWGNMSICPNFCPDINNKSIICAPANMLTSIDENIILYLLAFLNSKITQLYISWFGYSREGGYFEYKKIFVEKIPIPINIDKKPFVNLVTSIIKNKSLNLDIQDLEIQLNNLIYKLYNITDEEIDIINRK